MWYTTLRQLQPPVTFRACAGSGIVKAMAVKRSDECLEKQFTLMAPYRMNAAAPFDV